jgi:hypothetical protein
MMHLTQYLKGKLKSDQLGNIFFWVSFCIIGQPMCALLYYYDFLSRHSPHLLKNPIKLGEAASSAACQEVGTDGAEALTSAFMATVMQ